MRSVVAPLVACGALVLAGCTSGPTSIDQVLGTPTPTPTPTAAVPTVPASRTDFPKTCPNLVTATEVLAALGRESLPGRSTYVYAGPVPSSGRLERTTCGFGVSPVKGKPTQSVARVEVSMVRYRDAAAAERRVAATADSARGNGKRVSAVTVAGRSGYLITDAASSYEAVADRDRTVVVTIGRDQVRPGTMRAALDSLVRAALGIAAATATPSG